MRLSDRKQYIYASIFRRCSFSSYDFYTHADLRLWCPSPATPCREPLGPSYFFALPANRACMSFRLGCVESLRLTLYALQRNTKGRNKFSHNRLIFSCGEICYNAQQLFIKKERNYKHTHIFIRTHIYTCYPFQFPCSKALKYSKKI